MGHLMLISEDVITAMARFPPELRLNIIQYAPEPEWDQFVTGRYNETKQEDNRLLGGGKPVIKSSAARGLNDWKVDESEMSGVAGGSAGNGINSIGVGEAATRVIGGDVGGLRGDLKRNPISTTVKQTADFGPPPIADEDDDNVASSRAPHVCSNYTSCGRLSDHVLVVRKIPRP